MVTGTPGYWLLLTSARADFWQDPNLVLSNLYTCPSGAGAVPGLTPHSSVGARWPHLLPLQTSLLVHAVRGESPPLRFALCSACVRMRGARRARRLGRCLFGPGIRVSVSSRL